MVTAGKPVDSVIDSLVPLLEEGDVIMDGGNSHYEDTERRYDSLKAKGIGYLGIGISGGEIGALKGPSIMPGGDRDVYEKPLRFSQKSPPKWMEIHAVSTSVRKARVILSKWCTTASNTQTCSSSPKHIRFKRKASFADR